MDYATEREAAFEILLLMADADAGWNDYEHAIELLDIAAEARGGLPVEYALKRDRWSRLSLLTGVAA